MSSIVEGVDGKLRCRWCGAAPEFLDNHDKSRIFTTVGEDKNKIIEYGRFPVAA